MKGLSLRLSTGALNLSMTKALLRQSLLFFLAVAISMESQAKTSADKYKPIIDEAYSLLAQRQRALALRKLMEIPNEAGGLPPREAQEAIERVGTYFLSYRAQQLYEFGISLKISDPGTAQTKMAEAAKLEPDNLSVLLESFRIQGLLGECSNALTKLQNLPKNYFFWEPLSLLQAQLMVCSNQYGGLEGLRPLDLRKSKMKSFWEGVEAERLFKSGKFEEALLLTNASTQENPELYYWRGASEAQLKMPPESSYQKYSAACRKLTGRTARELSPEIHLCRHVLEVETYLKKSHNPSQ